MRIALLSTVEKNPEAGRKPPAFEMFAGARIIERQLDLALSMGCEKVICLTSEVGAEVIELQHRAEQAGAKFVALRDTTRLPGQVTAADEILVIDSGVLPDNAAVERGLAKPGVLAFPADQAVALGYERIDADFAWSGILLTHGSLVEKLADLPPDSAVHSTLMRLSLQRGMRPIPLKRRLLDEGEWSLDADHAALRERERRWIDAQREAVSITAPGLAVAEGAGGRLARDVVGTKWERMPLIIAILSALIALALAIVDRPDIGLIFTALAALSLRISTVIDRIARKGRSGMPGSMTARILGFAIDPLFIILLVIAAPEKYGWLAAFVPLVLIGLLRLGEMYGSEKWRPAYADRVMLGFILAPAAFFGFATEVAALIALVALGSRLFSPFRAD